MIHTGSWGIKTRQIKGNIPAGRDLAAVPVQLLLVREGLRLAEQLGLAEACRNFPFNPILHGLALVVGVRLRCVAFASLDRSLKARNACSIDLKGFVTNCKT